MKYKKLLMLFWGMIIVPVITAIFYETDVLLPGDFAGNGYESTEFIVTIVMELLTLVSIPSALRLLKVAGKKICDAASLSRYSPIRMAMLIVPLWGNTLLYYLFMNATFGYMAIITLIAMVFVYPPKQQSQNDGEKD
ncbi:MAG: hypothetical protein J6C65_02745 [Prevotella sp.]|nr:hypothetical protein [Prevotella sp.]MBO5205660.1 hypothetical protein [Prevotella sp.]